MSELRSSSSNNLASFSNSSSRIDTSTANASDLETSKMETVSLLNQLKSPTPSNLCRKRKTASYPYTAKRKCSVCVMIIYHA